LPNGVFVEHVDWGMDAYLVWNDGLLLCTAGGYKRRIDRSQMAEVLVLTPESTLENHPCRLRPRSPTVGKSPCMKDELEVLPLYEDAWFTFRFADDRLIARFQLEFVEAWTQVTIFKIDPATGERLGLLATATVGEGGWVDLPESIIVRAGDAFIAVPESRM
jgi:hypothetical protein